MRCYPPSQRSPGARAFSGHHQTAGPSIMARLGALAFVAILAGLGLLGLRSGTGHAQEAPPIAPAAERMLFAPLLGFAKNGSNAGAEAQLRDAYAQERDGLRVQNAGTRPVRFLMVYSLTGHFPELVGSSLDSGTDPAGLPRTEQADLVLALKSDPSMTVRPGLPIHSDRPQQNPEACAECAIAGAVCSDLVAPGRTWHFGPTPFATSVDDASLYSGTVYSLNSRPAADYDPDWEAWLLARDRDRQTSLADILCDELAMLLELPGGVAGADGEIEGKREILQRGDVDCPLLQDFHRAYLQGGRMDLFGDLSLAPARGEPAAALSAPRMPSIDELLNPSLKRPALDRFEALRLEEADYLGLARGELSAGPVDPTQSITHTYIVPGIYTQTMEGRLGILTIQNPGLGCANIQIEGFPTTSGSLVPAPGFQVPAGKASIFAPSSKWQTPDPITVRILSDQPLAIVATNFGYATSASWPAISGGNAGSGWAIPRAFQEPKPVPLQAEVAQRRLDFEQMDLQTQLGDSVRSDPAFKLSDPTFTLNDPAAPHAAEGRETNVSVFNAGDFQGRVEILTRAEGHGERSVTLPLSARIQSVFQLGFGLAGQGGPGWARFLLRPDDLGQTQPLYVALESFRYFTDVPAASEVWASAGWPMDLFTEPSGEGAAGAGPRAIAIPDLAGPAVGPVAGLRALAGVTTTRGITTAFTTRLAIQNLAAGESRVAIDGYAPHCGFVGTAEHAIEAGQTLTLPAGALPGAAWGSDSAMLRILAGNVALMVETAREEQFSLSTAPPDLSTAYLGIPLRAAAPPPALPQAMLATTPTEFRLAWPTDPVTRSLRIEDPLASGRCLSYRVSSDADWLTVDHEVGAFPAEITLTVNPARLGRGPRKSGHLRFEAVESDVMGSPASLLVVVEEASVPPPQPRIYLPLLRRDRGDA